MSLEEKMKSIVETMRRTKEDWVSSEPENTDLAMYLHIFRGDDMVASLICPLNRDKGLHAANVAARGFIATTLSLTFESYSSELKESPVTGEHWRPGEMQYVAQTDPKAAEKGWVNECVTTMIIERGGDYAIHGMPYEIVDGKVTWLEERLSFSSDADRGDGVMIEALQAAMSGPTLTEILDEARKTEPELDFVMESLPDQEVQTFHADAATVAFLTEHELIIAAMLSAEPGSVRERLLDERFGSDQP